MLLMKGLKNWKNRVSNLMRVMNIKYDLVGGVRDFSNKCLGFSDD